MLNIPCTYNRCSPNEFSLYVLIFRKSLKRQYVRTGNLSNPSPSKWGQHIIRDAANCCLTVQLADVLADFAWLGALGECWCCLLALIFRMLEKFLNSTFKREGYTVPEVSYLLIQTCKISCTEKKWNLLHFWEPFWTDAAEISSFWFAKIKALWKFHFVDIFIPISVVMQARAQSVLNHVCFYSAKLVRFTTSP